METALLGAKGAPSGSHAQEAGDTHGHQFDRHNRVPGVKTTLDVVTGCITSMALKNIFFSVNFCISCLTLGFLNYFYFMYHFLSDENMLFLSHVSNFHLILSRARERKLSMLTPTAKKECNFLNTLIKSHFSIKYIIYFFGKSILFS